MKLRISDSLSLRIHRPIVPRTHPEPPPVAEARWIPLTQGRVALVDASDHAALSVYSWSFHWNGYAFRRRRKGESGPAQIRMHRQIMGLVDDPTWDIDHRNGNGLDNRRGNLRLATNRENRRNGRGRRRSIPYKGVYSSGRPRKPWSAKINVGRLTINLGRFETQEQAARAYDKAAVEHFGEFARTNAMLADAGDSLVPGPAFEGLE